AVSRQAQRAGLRRRHRRRGGRPQGDRTGSPGPSDQRQFLSLVRQGEPAGAMRVTILGCGASTGVPAIGPDWGRCDPGDPRNRRRRVSVLVQIGATIILIDTSPDLREQLLDADVARLDAVLLTHAHADHLHGIDDMRSVNRLMQSAIPLYADAQTLAEVGRRFGYVLRPIEESGRYYKPVLVPHEIMGSFELQGIPILTFVQDH